MGSLGTGSSLIRRRHGLFFLIKGGSDNRGPLDPDDLLHYVCMKLKKRKRWIRSNDVMTVLRYSIELSASLGRWNAESFRLSRIRRVEGESFCRIRDCFIGYMLWSAFDSRLS